jgi:hypothetical protein
MDLGTVSTELYGLPPADFTHTRDARASEAKRAGDRELASAIAKLRRPNVGAWLANVLVRERGDQVQIMLDVGAEIRQAQAQSAKDELRKLQRERRRAIAALLDDAADLARDRGESISSAVTRDLEMTLEAALLDPEAGTALKAGLLTTGLRYAGLGGDGATDNASGSGNNSEPATMVSQADKSDPALPTADDARLGAAEAQLEAESRLAEAGRDADERKRRVEEAVQDRDIWRRKVADLDQQLASAQEEAKKAEQRFADAEEALALSEQRLRTVQAYLVEENNGLSG